MQVYNDAYRAIMGSKHPAGLGRPTRECWPEAWTFNAPIYDAVMRGEARSFMDQSLTIVRHGVPEEAFFDLTYSPLRDGPDGAFPNGRVAGVLVTVVEVTRRVLADRELRKAEELLRASEARGAFLLRLSDALRPLADARSIEDAAMGLLGPHLGVNRAIYFEVGPDGDTVEIGPGYRDGVAGTAGRARLSDFWDGFAVALRAGRASALDDVATAEGLTQEQRRALGAVETRAALGVPLIKGGRFVAGLGLQQATPRTWTPAEIVLVEEVAERTWEASQRARAEAALRESEERFRAFAENPADTIWIANRDGTALEYLSPAFERTFGEPREAILADLRRWGELLHPDDREPARTYLPRVLAGELVVVHYRIVRPSDGSTVWLRDTGFPVRDASGAITRVAGIVQDITDI